MGEVQRLEAKHANLDHMMGRIILRRPDNEEAVKSYEETKSLSVSLLGEYANHGGDDLVPAQGGRRGGRACPTARTSRCSWSSAASSIQ